MAFQRLHRLAADEALGAHFAAVFFMGPLSVFAIVALREVHLVAPTPIWLIPLILVAGQPLTIATGVLWHRSPTRARLHMWIATQAILVTAIIYATGWGPALGIGLVLVGQESLAVAGSSSERAIVSWTLSCLAVGEGLIALGWVPTLIPVPEVHGLAVLMAIGIAFSYRSLRSALIEREKAAALTESRERRFRALVQSSSDLVFTMGATGAVTYASPSCTKVLGYEPQSLLGSESGVLVHDDDREDLGITIQQARSAPGASVEICFRVRHQGGTWRWLEGLATNLLDDQAVAGIVINARDVTERRARAERQTALSDLGREVLQATTLEAAMESATNVIKRVIHARDCSIVGIHNGNAPMRESLGGAAELLDGHLHLADHNGLPNNRVPVGDPARPLAHIEVVKDGGTTTEDAQFIEGVSGIVLSAAIRFGAEDAIRHQAMHDPLTGLPNRALFNDRLEHALRRHARDTDYVAVMIVDLDGFKNINDSLGHLTGDALLIAVAERFQARLRGFDTIARLGGDEFALLFDELSAPDQAGRVAGRVLDALVLPMALPDRDVAVSASVGIALTNQAGARVDRLLADADAAMYRAKREGKGCYRVFEADMHTAAVERMTLEQELRTAIRDHALTVFYQPIIETNTRRITSFEALARWQHPTRGFVPPDVFIPLAEESGLIVDLGRAVLIEACQRARQWHLSFPELRPSISVNASRLQLANPGFIEHVSDALKCVDLDPSSLIIEVTESVLASESGHLIATLDALRGEGVRVAIDDFGTGYSSLAALAELPIDILKIDKRFVDNLVSDDQGRGFVTAIMHLAATLHLETTAEGVENLEQLEALAMLGCTNIQGFLFSPPIPAQQSHDYLTRVSGSAGANDIRVAVGGLQG